MTATQSTQPAERSFADRLLRILDVFDVGRSRMPLSEISRRSGLPLATTHRMVAKLAAWGALERGDDGLYHIGLRLWEVAMLAPRGLGLRAHIGMAYLLARLDLGGRPFLDHLARRRQLDRAPVRMGR